MTSWDPRDPSHDGCKHWMYVVVPLSQSKSSSVWFVSLTSAVDFLRWDHFNSNLKTDHKAANETRGHQREKVVKMSKDDLLAIPVCLPWVRLGLQISRKHVPPKDNIEDRRLKTRAVNGSNPGTTKQMTLNECVRITLRHSLCWLNKDFLMSHKESL